MRESLLWVTAKLVTIFIGLVFGMLLLVAIMVTIASRVTAYDGCKPYPVGPYSPTGIVGCQVYGEGIASWYHGTGVARNDCVYPWIACQPIRITSLDTGRSVVVTPTMFCDCYTGTPDERLVDLDPETVQRLGLNPSRGLFPVRVEPWVVGSEPPTTLPDTAMAR